VGDITRFDERMFTLGLQDRAGFDYQDRGGRRAR